MVVLCGAVVCCSAQYSNVHTNSFDRHYRWVDIYGPDGRKDVSKEQEKKRATHPMCTNHWSVYGNVSALHSVCVVLLCVVTVVNNCIVLM